ncbi:nucleotidyl transferase AbiEii/AbiGii toxin family protein [Streptomyces fagopyri]|uniref:nucleotidyl transferase AbiEii/AbiGii toxin family protein n=1 Tax=Streptomyces fagopyri TaxID=2662397 RepID=UPI0033CFBD3C
MTDRFRDATALRRALEVRLKQQAVDTGTALRRRRLVVFDRAAARLSADPAAGWVLKGGAVMEFRLHGRARTTKDMALAARPDGESGLDGSVVRELLIDALAVDEDKDGFLFQVSPPIERRADTTGRGGWRFSVESRLAGTTFATVRIDVVARREEIALTERLPLPNTLGFAGTTPRDIEAVDRRQHFAEKLHAFTCDYGDRPNTRVKDLVDLVLLIESGLVPDTSVVGAVRHVFAVRATHEVPAALPEPPPSWAQIYPELAESLTDTPPRLDAALDLVRGFWCEASDNGEAEPKQKD